MLYVNAPRRSVEAVNHLVSRNNPSGNFVEEEAPSSLALVEAFEPESAEENETNSNDKMATELYCMLAHIKQEVLPSSLR